IRVQLTRLPPHNAGAWALAPALMRNRHHRGLDDVGMSHDRVLELNRADPLASGFDEILGPIDELDEPILTELGDVPGAQPAVVGELLGPALLVVVGAGDRR